MLLGLAFLGSHFILHDCGVILLENTLLVTVIDTLIILSRAKCVVWWLELANLVTTEEALEVKGLGHLVLAILVLLTHVSRHASRLLRYKTMHRFLETENGWWHTSFHSLGVHVILPLHVVFLLRCSPHELLHRVDWRSLQGEHWLVNRLRVLCVRELRSQHSWRACMWNWLVCPSLFQYVKNCLKALAKKPWIRSIFKFWLFCLVTELLATQSVVNYLFMNVSFVLDWAESGENRVLPQQVLVLGSRDFFIDDLHGEATARESIFSCFQLVLDLHKLDGTRTHFRVVY